MLYDQSVATFFTNAIKTTTDTIDHLLHGGKIRFKDYKRITYLGVCIMILGVLLFLITQ